MARVQPYERVVDAVLTKVLPAPDTEIQNEVKIKQEPNIEDIDARLTEDHKLVENSSNATNHDKSLILENNVLRNNNKENKHVANSEYLATINKRVNLKRKNSKVREKQIHDTSLPPKKKGKYSNNASKYEDTNTSRKTNEAFKRKKLQSATLNSETKIKHTPKTRKKKSSRECDVCFRKFSSPRNCEYHKQYYDLTGNFKCKICKKHFTTRDQLNSHILSCHHTYSNSVKFARMHCHFCNRPFKDRNYLQSHLFHLHNKLVYSGNINKCKNVTPKKINSSRKNNTSKTDEKSVHEESPCSNNPTTSEKLNTTPINNETPTKKLRQPTLTEYLELCQKRRDIKPSPDKSDINRKDFLTLASDNTGQTKSNPKRKILQDDDGYINSSSIISSTNFPEMMNSAPTQSQKHDASLSKRPFVKVHADVEMMKSFLENLSDTITKDNIIKDLTNDSISYDSEIPYKLRSSLKVTPVVEASTYMRTRRRSNMSGLRTENNATKMEQNMPDSEKVNPNFGKSSMVRFKCKDCTIPLIKYDDESRDSTNILKNSFIPQSNSMLFQESDIRNEMRFKELEVSVERLATFPPADLNKEAISGNKEHSDNSFLCKICNKSFSSKSAKRDHIKSSHIAYMSSICDARFTLKYKLLQHYLQEHLFKSDQCCICYTLLPDYASLKRHLYVHCLKYIQRGDDQYPVDIEINCNSAKAYKCPHCCEAFSSRSILMVHQSSCTKQTEMKESNKEDSMREVNMSPKSVSGIQREENSEKTAVIHNEDIHSIDLCKNAINGSVEKLNNRQMSLLHKKESQISKDNQNLSVSDNKGSPEEIRTVDKSQESQVSEGMQNSSVSDNGENSKEIRTINKSQIIEDIQNSPVNDNGKNLEKIKTVNKPQNAEKLSGNDNSAMNKDTASSTQSDNTKSQEIHPCDICGKQFHKRKNLEQHIRTYNYFVDVCPMCGTGFSSKRLLRTHIAAAHVPQISTTYAFHCMFCNQGFIKKHELRPHVLHLHGKQILDTLTHDSRTNQKKSDKSSTYNAICNVCNLVFETFDRYVEHRMYYYKNHSFTCSLCSQNFQGMYMFHHHNKLMHYSEDKRKSYSYICEICNEGFNHESHFHSHNMHVHSSDEMSIDTKKEYEEESLFDRASEEAQKIRNLSTKKPQKEIARSPIEYPCQICQLKCANLEDMIKHIALYSNDGKFKCDKCDRRCQTLTILEEHKKLTHICRDIYDGHLCHICGELLETITSLNCHTKHFHSNDDADNCKNCGQKLSADITGKGIEHKCESNSGKLNKYRYDCLFCDMKFIDTDTIQTHIAQAHIDELLTKAMAVLKPTFSTVNSNNIWKQFAQQLTKINQVSSSASLSEGNTTQSLQQSDNIPNNTSSEKNSKDKKIAIESSDQSKSTLSKNDKNTEKIPTPAAPLINIFKDNLSASMKVTPSNESKSIIPVSLPSRNIYGTLLTPVLNAKFKTNFASSSNQSTEKSGKSVNSSSTERYKSVIVVPQHQKNYMKTYFSPKIVKNYNSNHIYLCPLCPLEYPSLNFFHAHLRYAHTDAIRSGITPQLNVTTQRVSSIQCLLCAHVFMDEMIYKNHLKSHTQYIYIPNPRDEINVKNMSKLATAQTSDNKDNATPEVITVDDDDVNKTSGQRTTESFDSSKQNDKIGKLRVKSFAKIIENLSTDHTSMYM